MSTDHLPDLIIIRGAPGSGKSQTAKSLSLYYPQGVRIETDTVRSMVISVNWTNQIEHKNMLQVTSNLTFNFLRLLYKPVIVIDTFSGDKLTQFLEKMKEGSDHLDISITGLFVSEIELEGRLNARNDNEFKNSKISKEINNEVQSFRYPNEFQIDTTGLTADQTARLIYNNIANIGK